MAARTLPPAAPFPSVQLCYQEPIVYTDGSYANGKGGCGAAHHLDDDPAGLSEGVLFWLSLPGAQSSYRAELVALRYARQTTDGRAIFAVDCLNLLRAIGDVVSGAAADDGLDEDFTALIDLLRRKEHPTALIKVKAHTKARYGRGDTPSGNIAADAAANRGTRDGTPPVPAAPSHAGPAGPPAPPSVSLVKRADGESLKRDALEAFALEHVLDERDAKRRNTTVPSIRQSWATIAREAELRIDLMPKLAS